MRSANWSFLPGECPSRGLLHDCENRWIVCSSSTGWHTPDLLLHWPAAGEGGGLPYNWFNIAPHLLHFHHRVSTRHFLGHCTLHAFLVKDSELGCYVLVEWTWNWVLTDLYLVVVTDVDVSIEKVWVNFLSLSLKHWPPPSPIQTYWCT